MKRILTIALCMLLILTGCAKQPAPTEPVQTAPPTTTAPTEPTETEPPVPETVSATALADKTYIVLLTAARDTAVEIAGEFDEDYYVVKTEQGYGLIEKRLVRMDGEEAYKQWTGYATHKAKLYSSYHLAADETESLSMNTEVTVLDTLGDCLVVQHGDTIGYMLEKQLSHHYIQPSTGGGGGNNSGGTGADGGDISLFSGRIVTLSTLTPQSGEVSGIAIVLANDTEVILGWFDRNDTMQIVTEDGFAEDKEGWYITYLDGLYGYVRQNLILKEGEEVYAQWDGYAHNQAEVYDNYYLSGKPVRKLSANAEIKVLHDLGNCYLVLIGEDIGYMAKDVVSDSYINYSSGGGGSGSDSSGGEWTPPVL